MVRREIETYAPREELSAAPKWALSNFTMGRLMRIPYAGAMRVFPSFVHHESCNHMYLTHSCSASSIHICFAMAAQSADLASTRFLT
jgi:hypothetical protein